MILRRTKLFPLILSLIFILIAFIYVGKTSVVHANCPSNITGHAYIELSGQRYPLKNIDIIKDSFCRESDICSAACKANMTDANPACWVGKVVYATRDDGSFESGSRAGTTSTFRGTPVEQDGCALCVDANRQPDHAWCGANCGLPKHRVTASWPTGYSASNFPNGIDYTKIPGKWKVVSTNCPSSSQTTINGIFYNIFSMGNDGGCGIDYVWTPDYVPQNLSLNGRAYCQDDGGTLYPIPGAKITVYKDGSKSTSQLTTAADGTFSLNATTLDNAFAVRFGSLPSGSLSTGQPYSSMSYPPIAVNCQTGEKTGCVPANTTGPMCDATKKSYEICSLGQGTHNSFDFRFTSCTPKTYSCKEVSTTTPNPKRGETIYFTCKGNGNDAKRANFRILRDGQEIASTVGMSIPLGSDLSTRWGYTIPDNAQTGNYVAQCQICNSQNQCTAWGKAQ